MTAVVVNDEEDDFPLLPAKRMKFKDDTSDGNPSTSIQSVHLVKNTSLGPYQ